VCGGICRLVFGGLGRLVGVRWDWQVGVRVPDRIDLVAVQVDLNQKIMRLLFFFKYPKIKPILY